MPRNKTTLSIRKHTMAVGIAAALLVASVGIMSAATELSGAVISSGTIVVESNVKKIQHPTGGVVKDLLVSDGQRVASGDILLRLDETIANANLGAVSKSYFDLQARLARLGAERDDRTEIEFPSDLLSAASADPAVAMTLAVERTQFRVRRDANQNRKNQLRERVTQLEEEIKGLNEQLQAKSKENEIIQTELTGVQKLWEQNLISISRLTALQRDAARILGDRGLLISSIAQSRGRIAETHLQLLQIDGDTRRDVSKEFAEVRSTLEETSEKRVAAQDVVNRLDIRSPQAGIVHDLAVHTKGGVIGAGETIMSVVPEGDGLILEAHVTPDEIDQVRLGQSVMIRFPNYNQRTTPEIDGTIVRIGADVSREDKSSPAYFIVRVAIQDSAISGGERSSIIPGMNAEVFIRTSERSVWSYLVKPLADQARRAFREK